MNITEHTKHACKRDTMWKQSKFEYKKEYMLKCSSVT